MSQHSAFQRLLVNAKKHRVALGTYGAFFVVWSILWQLTVLQGDDRFFAVASGIPWGYQTPYYVFDTTARTWGFYNGRIADGLGVLWYMFGDTFARFIYAFSYVLLIILLEKTIRLFVTLPPTKVFVVRLLLACAPFMITATNTAVGGESVFLAAAAWNYIIPLNLILLSFYPLMLQVSGKYVGRRVFSISLLAIFISLQMHEMLMIGVLGMVLGLLLYQPALLKDTRFRIISVVVFLGAVAKVLAPGLWRRSGKNGVGGFIDGLSPTEIRVIKAASVFSDFPVLYPLLGAFLITLVVVCVWIFKPESWLLKSQTGRWISIAGAAALVVWILLSWYHRLKLETLFPFQEQIPYVLSTKLLALLVVSALVFMGACTLWVNEVSRILQTPLPIVFFTGVITTIFTSAVMSHHLYAPLRRAHYVSLIFLALTCMIILVHLVLEREQSSHSWLVHSLVVLTIVLSAFSLLNVTSQLFQNRLAWGIVENEITQVKLGELDTVHYPEALPCKELTWYFWPEDIERNYDQLATYYDIPAGTRFETISQERPCLYIP